MSNFYYKQSVGRNFDHKQFIKSTEKSDWGLQEPDRAIKSHAATGQ